MEVRNRNVVQNEIISNDSNKNIEIANDEAKNNKKNSSNKSSNGFFWLFLIIFVLFPLLFIVASPIYSPKGTLLKTAPITLPDLIPLKDALEPNNLLEKATYIAHKKLVGPETIVFKNGTLYTGLMNGQLVSVDQNGDINKIVQMGDIKDETICENIKQSNSECGRPIGLRFKPNTDLLYVADGFNGIYKVDVVKKTKELVLSANDERFSNLPLKFLNDLDFDDDVIYFVDTSYERDISEVLDEHIASTPFGRLFSFNENTNELNLLLDNLYFANGLQLMPNKDAILISESTMARILKYYVKGPNKGKKETFANLPGFGDNLRLTDHYTLLVPIAVLRSKYFSILDSLGQWPTIRSIIGSLFNIEYIFRNIPKYGLLIEYDLNGQPIRSWHDPTGKTIESISSAFIHNNKIYLGSFYIDYIGVADYL